jgi:zinc D-Ala-D-Ala dipeptidase
MHGIDTYVCTPVPELEPVRWKRIFSIPIVECGEPLVPISLYPERILARSSYFIQGYREAYAEIYLREGVYEKLVQAADSLPPAYRLVVYDGWRPVDLQFTLHEEYVEGLRERYPEKSEEEVRELASHFVAAPSTDPSGPSPHSTGASLDLTIADEKGRLLYMGAVFDEKSERSETTYFESVEEDAGRSLQEARDNRRLLYHVMTYAGFTNYSAEWWHYDYGNQNWIYFSGLAGNARYGIVEVPLGR